MCEYYGKRGGVLRNGVDVALCFKYHAGGRVQPGSGRRSTLHRTSFDPGGGFILGPWGFCLVRIWRTLASLGVYVWLLGVPFGSSGDEFDANWLFLVSWAPFGLPLGPLKSKSIPKLAKKTPPDVERSCKNHRFFADFQITD